MVFAGGGVVSSLDGSVVVALLPMMCSASDVAGLCGAFAADPLYRVWDLRSSCSIAQL